MNLKIIKPNKDEYLHYMKMNNINISETILKSINDGITIPYLEFLCLNDYSVLVSYGYIADFYDNGIVTIYDCKTIDKYQGQGFFAKLFAYIIDDLENQNKYKKVTLGVDSTNIKNQEMYKKWGFSIREGVTSEWTYPDGRVETILWFEKHIENKELLHNKEC